MFLYLLYNSIFLSFCIPAFSSVSQMKCKHYRQVIQMQSSKKTLLLWPFEGSAKRCCMPKYHSRLNGNVFLFFTSKSINFNRFCCLGNISMQHWNIMDFFFFACSMVCYQKKKLIKHFLFDFCSLKLKKTFFNLLLVVYWKENKNMFEATAC